FLFSFFLFIIVIVIVFIVCEKPNWYQYGKTTLLVCEKPNWYDLTSMKKPHYLIIFNYWCNTTSTIWVSMKRRHIYSCNSILNINHLPIHLATYLRSFTI